MHFGFSYVGLIYLAMLFVPNFFWTKNKPADYDIYVINENKILAALERMGQFLVCPTVLAFSDFNMNQINHWSLVLLVSFLLMVLYEIHWLRYFKSPKTMQDFYSSLLGIPVAGATLPILAFLMLGIYGKNICLIVATVILGIGHIGIHLAHKKEAEAQDSL